MATNKPDKNKTFYLFTFPMFPKIDTEKEITELFPDKSLEEGCGTWGHEETNKYEMFFVPTKILTNQVCFDTHHIFVWADQFCGVPKVANKKGNLVRNLLKRNESLLANF